MSVLPTRARHLGGLLATATLLAVGAGAPASAAVLPPSLTVDTTFSAPAGIARFDFRPGNTAPDVPNAIAAFGGDTYTVGQSASPTQNPDRGVDVAVIARRGDGSLDPGFNGTGTRSIPVAAGNGLDTANDVTVLQDGRLRIAGQTDVDPTNVVQLDAMLIGLMPDGTPDRSFGQDLDADGTRDGVQIFSAAGVPSANDERLSGLAVDPATGRIAVAGPRSDGGQDDIFVSLREPDGSPVADFGTNGVRVIDRGAAQRDDRPTDVQFRPGGGVMVLVDADTNTAAALDGEIAILRAFTADGQDDKAFGDNGELTLTPGTSDTIPSRFIVDGGRYYVTGRTRPGPGTDSDAFLTRVDVDGTNQVSRRFDLRGQVVPGGEAALSEGLDLQVVPGVPRSLLVVGSTEYAFAGDRRLDWGAAAFNGFDGDLATAGFTDLVLDTPNRVNRLRGVAVDATGTAVVAGPLDAEPRSDGSVVQDTSFGNARLRIDVEKRCNLAVRITAPVELVFRGLDAPSIDLEVEHVGTRPCAGVVRLPAPYAASRPLTTALLTPGDKVSFTNVGVAYGGPRPVRQGQLTATVTPVGDEDSDPADNTATKITAFSYCDVGVQRLDDADELPNEGSRSFEVKIRNSGTLSCGQARLALSGNARLLQPFDPFALIAGGNASDELPVAAPKGARIGRDVSFAFVASSAVQDLNPFDNVKSVKARVVAVGDTRIRSANARTLRGTATGGRGGRTKASTRLRSVEVSVQSLSTKRCRFLASRSGRLSTASGTRRKGCRTKTWVRVSGASKWKLKLKRRLPAGRYRVESRAITRNGFAEAKFGSRDRNTRSFRAR